MEKCPKDCKYLFKAESFQTCELPLGENECPLEKSLFWWVKEFLLFTFLVIVLSTFVLGIFLTICTSGAQGAEWTKTDVTMEIVTEALLVADWSQTKYGQRHPNQFNETNMVLGDHPSADAINGYFAGWLIIHPVVTHILIKEDLSTIAKMWNASFIAVELSAIRENYVVGVQMRF